MHLRFSVLVVLSLLVPAANSACNFLSSDGVINITLSVSGDQAWFDVKGQVGSGWMAVGVNTATTMAGTDFAWIWSEGADVQVADCYASGRTKPSQDTTSQLTVNTTTKQGNELAVVFSRPLDTGASQSVAIPTQGSFFVTWAHSTSGGSFAALSTHNSRGSVRLDLSSCEATNADAGKPTKWGIHGVLMTVSMAILMPVGALLPKIAKAWAPTWFFVHRGVQGVAAVLMIIGFAIGLNMVDDHFTNKTHAGVGIAAVVIAILNVLSGIVRPHDKTSTTRKFWKLQHGLFGSAIVSLSFLNVHEGLSIYGGSTAERLQIVLLVWVIVWVLTMCVGPFFAPKPEEPEEPRKNSDRSATKEAFL